MQNQSNNSSVGPRDFKPVKILDVEISQPLPDIPSVNEKGDQVYQRAMLLVRLHSYPLGVVHLDFESQEIPASELAVHLWSSLSQEIKQHLQQDDLPIEDCLPEEGLQSNGKSKCLVERQELLKDAPLISIVLATRDRANSLSIAGDSLLELDYPHYEIILVDNAPQTAETQGYFLKNQARFMEKNVALRYVREDIPGLAVAHNRGLESVRGSIVAFTDDDVVLDRHWLAEILYGFKAAPSVGCVTGLVIPLELQTPAQVLFEEFGGFTKGFTKQIYDLDDHQPANPLFPYAAGRFGTGANMAFKTELLLKAGGFDPALGTGTPALGADDMAAFFQTIIQGHQLVYQPTAVVYHQHRRTYEGLRKQMFGYGTGLTAFLTKCLLDYPNLLLDITSKIPAGIKYVFDPKSAKNQQKTSRYPHELERIERKGMLYGPIAYLISRWRYRKLRKSHTPPKRANRSAFSQTFMVKNWREDYQKNKRTKEL